MIMINKIRVINAYMNYKQNRDVADLEFESTSFYFQDSWLKTAVEKDKRAADIQLNGLDTKFAYQLVRLILEAEQILIEHDLDLKRKPSTNLELDASKIYQDLGWSAKHDVDDIIKIMMEND